MSMSLDTIIQGPNGDFKKIADITIGEKIEFRRQATDAQFKADCYNAMIRGSDGLVVASVCDFIRKAFT